MVEFKRHRRLRQSANMRALVKETYVHLNDLIYPIFITEEENSKTEISSMPGIYQFSIDRLKEEMDEVQALGIKSVLLFGIPKEKTNVEHKHSTIMVLFRKVSNILKPTIRT